MNSPGYSRFVRNRPPRKRPGCRIGDRKLARLERRLDRIDFADTDVTDQDERGADAFYHRLTCGGATIAYSDFTPINRRPEEVQPALSILSKVVPRCEQPANERSG
jgi:hypothetical protein